MEQWYNSMSNTMNHNIGNTFESNSFLPSIYEKLHQLQLADFENNSTDVMGSSVMQDLSQMTSQNAFTAVDCCPLATSSHMQEDQRNLQLALELSNLSNLSAHGMCSTSMFENLNSKKSLNFTECVPVPTSEHVAEIVGRQGCKIKALRQRTNTYIKTPMRGDDPMFVVTGRKEDVFLARREIQSAAEHFTQIRASRDRHTILASRALSCTAVGTSGIITIPVPVPLKVVGLVVGPKGSTIKKIQHETHTYIITPARDKHPVFEVTGLPENAEKAKEEILAHIAARTGAEHGSIDEDFKNNGIEVGSPSIAQPCNYSTASTAFQAPSQSSDFAFLPINSDLRSTAPSFVPSAAATVNPITRPGPTTRSPVFNDEEHLSMVLRKSAAFGSPFETARAQREFERTIKVSPKITTSLGLRPTSTFAHKQHIVPGSLETPLFSLATVEEKGLPGSNAHAPVRRVASEDSTSSSIPSLDNHGGLSEPTRMKKDLATTSSTPIDCGYSSCESESPRCSPAAHGSEPMLGVRPQLSSVMKTVAKKDLLCLLCSANQISAALVPCGHNRFCMECAQALVAKSPALCPCCKQETTSALEIKK